MDKDCEYNSEIPISNSNVFHTMQNLNLCCKHLYNDIPKIASVWFKSLEFRNVKVSNGQCH